MEDSNILYSTGCPKCRVLEEKLRQNNIVYSICDNTETMKDLGITSIPALHIDGKILSFSDAIKYLNNLSDEG